MTVIAPPPPRPLERAPVPSFSILISAFQAAPFIAEAVASALGQTLRPQEVIVCDDGSTDDLKGALEPFLDQITLIRQDHAGTAAAANTALAAASADFVVQLGADDVFEPERLEALGALAAARPDLEILATDVAFEIDGNVTGSFSHNVPFPVSDQRTAALRQCFCAAPAMRRIRLLALGGFDESLATGEDWDILLRLVYLGCVAGLVDAPLYRYRLRAESLTGKRLETLRDRVTLLERFAHHPGLTAQEWIELKRSLSVHRGRLTVAEAETSLRTGMPDARRRAVRAALTRSSSPATRALALEAAVAPGRARRRLERRATEPGRSALARSAWHTASTVTSSARIPAVARDREPLYGTDSRPARVLVPAPGERAGGNRRQTFSVVIPAYQAAPFVADAIASALAQEPRPLEVIVCDDGSTDEIEAAVAPYRDDIVFLRQAHSGTAAAKNRAAGVARGDFVCVLDADDRYAPGYLRAVSELAAARPDLDIVTTDAYLERDGRVFARYYRGKSRFVVDDQRRGIIHQHFVLATAAYRRERMLRIGGYDESTLAEDTEFLIRMILDGARVGLVDEPLYVYRLRSRSLSSYRARSLRMAVILLERTRSHPGLTPDERSFLEHELAMKRQEAELAEAEEAVRDGVGARSHALRIAVSGEFGFGVRGRALAAALAPAAAARFLASREQRTGRSRLARRSHGR